MNEKKYSLGIDFGTLSARAVLLDLQNGKEVCTSVFEYPHGIMDEKLPSGVKLGHDWALQHPKDYIEALSTTIPDILKRTAVSAKNIIGVGIDFTACTVLPVTKDGTPLCFFKKNENKPHAYAKLWKHHAAQSEATKINNLAKERNESWIENYGGKISSEWALPKLLQILNEDIELYHQTDRFIELADWIVWQLVGKETRNVSCAGYKELWNKKNGYPNKAFLKALDKRFENSIEEKFGVEILPLGTKAGEITKEAAALTGLDEGTAVAVGNIDAHVCVPAAGIDGPGKLLAIIGTSTCHIVMGENEVQMEGMSGVVDGGVMPGYFGYEAGQSCVGDHFDWFVKNACPEHIAIEAKKLNISLQEHLTSLAKKQKPAQHGLVALDWWNGNRSVLMDADLSGVIVGATLSTRPEDIYRALLEATAFGTRIIVENYNKNKLKVNALYASGGISQKNSLMMQIYSDVLNMPIYIAESLQGAAVGSAMFGAVAAGKQMGGFETIFEAARSIGRVKEEFFSPISENVEIYDALFKEYLILHDYFGRGENNVMSRLKALKARQK